MNTITARKDRVYTDENVTFTREQQQTIIREMRETTINTELVNTRNALSAAKRTTNEHKIAVLTELMAIVQTEWNNTFDSKLAALQADAEI